MGTPGKMIYLFLQSVVPTVPAGWLTFAEGAVYKAYDQAGAAVGHLGHHRPAARRGDHEDRRLDLPVDDHRVRCGSPASPASNRHEYDYKRGPHDADGRDRRPRRRPADLRRGRSGSSPGCRRPANRSGPPIGQPVASPTRDRRPPAAHRPGGRARGDGPARRPGAARAARRAAALDDELREITAARDAARARVNELSKEVGQLRRDRRHRGRRGQAGREPRPRRRRAAPRPTSTTSVADDAARAAARLPEPDPPRRPRRRRRTPTTSSSTARSTCRPSSPSTSGCRTGSRARRSASSTTSGRSRSAGRCSR